MNNTVTHPKHYNEGKIEVIEFIEDKELSYHRGNAIKYIARAGKKDTLKEIEDLEKAVWYLQREIEILRAYQEKREPCRPNDMNKATNRLIKFLECKGMPEGMSLLIDEKKFSECMVAVLRHEKEQGL